MYLININVSHKISHKKNPEDYSLRGRGYPLPLLEYRFKPSRCNVATVNEYKNITGHFWLATSLFLFCFLLQSFKNLLHPSVERSLSFFCLLFGSSLDSSNHSFAVKASPHLL